MKAGLQQEWYLFLLALQFMTRLPIPSNVPFSDDHLFRAARYYPLVGLVVGAIGGCILLLSAAVLPALAAVVLSIAATVYVTGAFHEDGLADTADGLGGGLTKERVLDIMRDSQVGSYGAVALVLTFGLKAALLAGVTPGDAFALLLSGHALSRFSAVQVMRTTEYARPEGAKFVAPSIDRSTYWCALAFSAAIVVVVALWLGWTITLAGIVLGVASTFFLRARLLRRLEGYTGDTLGAVQQVSEIAFYLGAIAAMAG
ncbi:MAG: adenosylcobinamide-GDP ribazoletransferase [Arenibacterium sp.]